MGYEANDAVMVVVPQYTLDATLHERYGDMFPKAPDVEAFRQKMPEEYRSLLVGPISNLINGGQWWVFGPDGSKEGWGISDEAEKWRAEFMELFSFTYSDGGSPYDVVHVRWGSDHGHEKGATIEYANDTTHNAAMKAAYDAACADA